METTDRELGDAFAVYFRRYPGKNIDEFNRLYGAEAAAMEAKVREVVAEAMRVEVDWTGLSLSQGGSVVTSVMTDRHPTFSAEAVEAIGNVYTFLMR
jgi:hypothetical protein